MPCLKKEERESSIIVDPATTVRSGRKRTERRRMRSYGENWRICSPEAVHCARALWPHWTSRLSRKERSIPVGLCNKHVPIFI